MCDDDEFVERAIQMLPEQEDRLALNRAEIAEQIEHCLLKPSAVS